MVLQGGKGKVVSATSSVESGPVSGVPAQTAGAGLVPAPLPSKSVWDTNPRAGRSNAPRSNAPRSNAPIQMLRSVLGANASKIDPDMADRLQNLNLNNQKPAAPEAYYDPSLAPEPEAIPDAWSGSSILPENSIGNYNVTVRTESCRRYPRTVADFKPGEIIGLPFHEPNLNPNNKMGPSCHRLSKTCEGPVFSKRRMLIILHLHTSDMFCLPLYSFEHRGLSAKPNWMLPEYCQLQNFGMTKIRQIGPCKPVDVKTYNPNKPMLETSCIHLTGGVKISAVEDINYIGRVTEESFRRLMTFYDNRVKQARADHLRWEPDRVPDANGKYQFPPFANTNRRR